jgi:pimeloyl-ACP methyl ester carboxylesterase
MRSQFGAVLLVLAHGFAAPIAGQGLDRASEFTTVDGVSLAYRVVGEGDPLVLLHGFYGTGEDWAAVAGELSISYQLIVPDLRGHGRSTNPTGGFTHRESARDIYALLDHLGIDHFKAVGFSSGGMTLLHMATAQPDRVEAVVLIGTTSYFPDQARELMLGSAPGSVSPSFLEAMAARHGDVERARALLQQFYDFRTSVDDMNFAPPFLATISAQALIVHGDRDPFFSVQVAVDAFSAIPNSYLWIVPNSGHTAFPSDDADREHFVATVLRFLSGSWN